MRDVAFDVANMYDDGLETSVAVTADDLVVEVHRAGTNQLFRRFGKTAGGFIEWFGPSQPYGTGANPKLAATVALVVEVHETPGSRLAYSLGGIGGGDFGFSFTQDYGTGQHPAVAISSQGLVIGIEESGDASHTLYYRIASYAPSGLSGWISDPGKRPIPGATGTVSSIAVNDQGRVVAVFQDPPNNRNQPVNSHTIVGNLVGTDRIDWGRVDLYDAVVNPSITLTDDGLVIVAALEPSKLLVSCRVGQVDRVVRVITFSDAYVCNTISNTIDPAKAVHDVSVSTNGRIAIETFSSQNKLGYAASLIQDRTRWMQENLPTLGNRTLKKIALPGSHDSSTYEIRDCSALGGVCNSKTQVSRIFAQLRAGSRYFDVRPVYYKKQLETGHFGNIKKDKLIPSVLSILGAVFLASISDNQGCDAAHFADVLADVRSFMQTGVHELVILKFSHYYDRDKDVESFDASVTTLFINAVKEVLGDYLYVRPPGSPRLADTPLNTLIGNRGIVLPVFDTANAGLVDFPPGVYRYLDFEPMPEPERPQFDRSDLLVYDKFANTNELETLSKDQVAKLQARQNHSGDLFLYSWTLTQGGAQALTCNDSKTFANDVLTLASIADAALAENIATLHANVPVNVPNIIYLDRVSGFAGDVAVFFNQRTYGGDTLVAAQRGYLAPGDSLFSASGLYQLKYFMDGGLILFGIGPAGNVARPVSNTLGQPAWRCILGEEGNFIVYSSPYTPVFSSNTSGAARLVLTDQATIVLYDASGNVVPSPLLA